jgi:hypothetical protein
MSLARLIDTLQSAEAEDVSILLEDTFEKIEETETPEEQQEMIAGMVTALIPALIWQKEEDEEMIFTAANIHDYFSFDYIGDLSGNEEIPEPLREEIQQYLDMPEMDKTAHDNSVRAFMSAVEAL